MRLIGSRLIVYFAAIIALSGVVRPAQAADDASERALGDSRVRAWIPAEQFPGQLGYPEDILVNGNRMYVTTPAVFGTVDTPPGRVLAFDVRDGELEETYVLEQLTQFEHGVSGLALDREDRLYVVDTQRGIVRFSADGRVQTPYSGPFPNLPANAHGDQYPLPNGIAFDDAGYAYVTDTLQGVIWRVAPGGGAPEVWFQDARLDTPFGPNGIRVSPDRTEVYFVVTVTDEGLGFVYRLPLVDHPAAEDLAVFRVYYGEGPDGLAFGASGRLYVALALGNRISVLDGQGTEIASHAGPAVFDSSVVPYDNPASIAFDNRTGSLLVTNHAMYSGLLEHFVVFDVYVDDRADPLPWPAIP